MRWTVALCAVPAMVLCSFQVGCQKGTSQSSVGEPAAQVEQTNGRSEPQKVPEKLATVTPARGAKPHVYDQVVALIVGIDEYSSSGIRKLSRAEQDAVALKDLLSTKYGYDSQLLLGEDASKRAVLGEIDRLGKTLGENDAFILYFAGHGDVVELPTITPPDYGRKGFLVPHDANLALEQKSDPRKWIDEAIDMTGLLARLEQMPTRHVLVIADCCCSGFLTKRGGFASRTDLPELVSMPSRIVLAATTSTQQADDGLFTQKLLEQLERSQAAGVTDLFLPLRRAVCAENRHMTPQMSHFGEGAGEFVFVPLEEPEGDVELALRQVVNRAADRVAQRTTLEDLFEAVQAHDYRYSSEPMLNERAWKAKLERFEQNASLSDPLAMAGLHYCISKGLGTDKDASKARQFAALAYQAGSPAGKQAYARCLLLGVDTPVNMSGARRLLEEASEDGFPISKVTLAQMILERRPDDAQRRTSEQLLTDAANAGFAPARYVLARGYSELPIPQSTFGRKDVAKAVEVLRPAVDAEYPAAMYQMFLISAVYPNVQGTVEVSQAYELLKRAASAGWPEALVDLAKVHLYHAESYGVRKNPPEVFDWLTLAAEQNFGEAHYVLSVLFDEGPVVARNVEKSLSHVRAASQLGLIKAKRRLAMCYEQGRLGLEQNFREAYKLYSETAPVGDAYSCYRLGILYRERKGVPTTAPWETDAMAAHWLAEATKRGDQDAEKALRENAPFWNKRSWDYLSEEHPDSAAWYEQWVAGRKWVN